MPLISAFPVNKNTLLIFLFSLFFSNTACPQEKAVQQILPGKCENNLFFVQPKTADGITVNLFTDTGGGGIFLFKKITEQLNLPLEETNDGSGMILAKLPLFRTDSGIPFTLDLPDGKIPVIPTNKTGAPNPLETRAAGLLGQTWFAGHCWTFDYKNKNLVLNDSFYAGSENPANIIKVGFKSDSAGNRQLNFPRITVVIGLDTLDMLFDTGASTLLTKEASATLGDSTTGLRAASFICSSLFNKWHKEHPEWRVIEGAELFTGAAMIEVPSVSIAGKTTGPAWFTFRPDPNFHDYMSRFTDKKVEGAIGGNILKNFRVTLDYPGAIAVFN